MKALIDGDICAYVTAASAKNEELWVATFRAAEFIDKILVVTGATEYELWFTGKGNFRRNIYPEYKANRVQPRPKWEQEVKSYLSSEYGAKTVDGCEADDMLGAHQTADTIICTIDKDLDQIAGLHYNWPIIRNGEVISEGKIYDVSPEEAYRFLCYQLIVGDSTDNIKGVVGWGKVKANKFLDSTSPDKWLEEIRELYGSQEEFEMNLACVYIWRKENDNYTNLLGAGIVDDASLLESKRQEVATDDSGFDSEEFPST